MPAVNGIRTTRMRNKVITHAQTDTSSRYQNTNSNQDCDGMAHVHRSFHDILPSWYTALCPFLCKVEIQFCGLPLAYLGRSSGNHDT